MRSKLAKLIDANELYFQALHECDLEKFDLIFHPSCNLFDADCGVLNVMPVAEYRAVIANRVSPMSAGKAREDAVLSADFLTPETAVTKVRLRINEKIFIDHLNWVYANGSFVIVAKIWHEIGAEAS
jgi:hypothetical protein